MTNNHQAILEDVYVDNGRNSDQFEKLLGNRCQTAPTLPALLPAAQIGKKLETRRKSDNSLLGSLNRLRYSIGSKDGPIQLNNRLSSSQLLSTVRPEKKASDPTIIDLRALQYNSDETIQLKLRYSEQ
ncbi:unnamed protein product [Diabrotica balteata]|uniref:Uncharacterized protein n=1 Tax=Diabrotica balteata TaxID=107213 RepID=A0A9N9SMG7_DIABA|nr:unnamed protein product [Diabrotica balteata]